MNAQAIEDRTAELLRVLKGKRRLLVLTHTNPDPDSIGSAVGLRHLAAEKLGLESDFGLSGRIMRAENKAMVEHLGIDMVALADLDISRYDCLAVVDTQPGFGHTVLPADRLIDIVIDHHVPPASPPPRPPGGFADVRTQIGATSSLVTSYLIDLGVEIPAEVATALLYGIRTDTADLSRNAGAIDEKAYYFLIGRVDRTKLRAITMPDLSLEYFRALRDALSSIRIFGEVVLCSLGKVASPEMVAEVADLLLRLEGKQAVYCGGLVGNKYYVSVRSELGHSDAYQLIRDALGNEGTFGGHGCIAGGSVDLPDDSQRTLKRLERRLEKNILQSQKVEDSPLGGLGDG